MHSETHFTGFVSNLQTFLPPYYNTRMLDEQLSERLSGKCDEAKLEKLQQSHHSIPYAFAILLLFSCSIISIRICSFLKK